MENFFLGLDLGGTKTKAVVINSKSGIIYESEGKGAGYHAMPLAKIEKNLVVLIKSIKRNMRGKIVFSCFGFAGADSQEDRIEISSFIKKGKIGKLLGCPVYLHNDVEIILPSVTEKNKGIAVIGGTGCNFYGMNKNKEAYASGLNCFISDEGSGFDIGLKVLRAAVRSFDGRGQKTILESLVKEKANIKNIRDLVDVVYAKDFEKTTIAGFAPLAEKAADKGDKIAKQILISAAGEYILGIKAVANKVGLKDKEFVIAFVGSTVNSKYIFPNIKDKIKKLFPKAILKKVENPAFGAAKLAMNYYIKNREGF